MSELISVGILMSLAVWGLGCHFAGKIRTARPNRSQVVALKARAKRRAVAAIVCLMMAGFGLLCLAGPVPASAQVPADFNINSVADKVDANPGDGICSTGTTVDGHTAECTLRAAIDEVNALSAAGNTRIFYVAVMPGTYQLTTNETCHYQNAGNPSSNTTTTAVLCITGNLTLNGADQATTIVDHALVDRDFFISSGYTVAINNMTIQNGAQFNGSSFGGVTGGGISNQGNLTLSGDLFFRNHSDGGGAGVDNSGTVVIEGSTFQANSGPGVAANYATTSIDGSYFTQNTAYQGPAVAVYVGTLNISNSTASANNVSENGIISSYNAVTTITNSTISNNTVGNAGAVVSGGNGSLLTLNNVTIAGNTAGNIIGGLFASPVTMSNTIVAGNSGYDCAVDSLTDLGHNLVQNPEFEDCSLTSSTDLIGVDAKLDAVSLDGGPTPTQSPLPGSPAIGAGSAATPGNNAVGACTAIDERGFVRGRSGACTIGAVEPLVGLAINNVTPNAGSPGGTARIVVHGSGFVPGSTLVLHAAGQSVPLLQTQVAPDTLSITASLDLSKAALGNYDVAVTTPAGASTTLADGYTVGKATAPVLYSYVYGPAYARMGRPAFYSIVYGNKGNADAYLVPLTFAVPGGFTGLISSPVLNPPVAVGQVVQDFTAVPVEVGPYSKTGFSNVPLIIPVIPAGSSGVIQFSITAPAGTAEGTPYALNVSLGSPYATALGVTVDPAVLASFVTGATSYAKANLGVTLTPGESAEMSTYAAAQLAQELALGSQALLESAAGSPVLFSNSQLLIDIATYGASLTQSGPAAAGSSSSGLQSLTVPATGAGPASTPTSNPCSGSTTTAGPACIPVPTAVPTPITSSFTSVDCMELPDHYVSPNGTLCLEVTTTKSVSTPGTLAGSVDPNAKDGPLGIGASHFTLGDDPFGYQIEFENTPTATAAAQTVSVTDPLDTTKYDLSTFQLGPISFGQYVLNPSPGLTSFASTLDLRPNENVIVAISANLDKSTGVASWNFTSLDPATLQLVTDPTAGFLPPDTAPPVGIGHVAFSVQPLPSVASGATVCNTASIVFDVNAAIATAPFCNSKDTTAPVSSVKPLPATESSTNFTVSWSGSDAGVGLAVYTIYVSVDGAAFTVWQNATASTSASYTGPVGHSYGFYSIATDLLGNTEGAKTKAEATTAIPAAQQAQTITFPPLANKTYGATPLTLTATASSGLPVSYTVAGPASLSGSMLTITGAGAVSVTATQAGNAHYFAATPVTQSFTVARAALAVVASNASRAYGAANPSFNFTITGFVKGDTTTIVGGSATLATTAIGTSPAGSYPITFATETLTAANYSFNYVAGTLTVTPAANKCTVVDYSKGFTSGQLSLNGSAKVVGDALQLTDGKQYEAASAYFSTPLPITSFVTDFTFQLLDPNADGMTFTIQAAGPHALGAAGGGLGYAGIPKSVAIKFDLYNNAGEGANSTGIYLNGASPTVPSASLVGTGIDLHSGHIFELRIQYDGTTTNLTLTDTATKVTQTASVQGSIAGGSGIEAAYFGFTAGTGAKSALQSILTWTYSGGAGCGAN